MNAVIYCRVSSKEQVEGTSLESQELACRDYAKRHNVAISKVFVEQGESAKFADRTQLLELLTYCKDKKKQIEILLVWKIDRFARNVEDHYAIKATLKKLGVGVVSVTEPIQADPNGKLMETILAGFAQFDNDVRAVRTVQGMQQRMREGIWPWKPPLGYLPPKIGKKTQPDQPDPRRFEPVQKAWQLLATGAYTKADILRLLRSWGIRAYRGEQVSAQLLDHLFRNPYYAGLVRDPWTGNEYQGRHVAMVSATEFARVQKLLEDRQNSQPHHRLSEAFPLRGVVRCPSCAAPMTGYFAQGKRKRYSYYKCQRPVCPTRSKSYAAKMVHEEFSQLLAETSVSPHLAVQIITAIFRAYWEERASVREAVLANQRDVARLTRQLQELISMRASQLISDAEFVSQRKQIKSELIDIQASSPHEEPTLLGDDELLTVSRAVSDLHNTWWPLRLDAKRVFNSLLLPTGYRFRQSRTPEKGLLFKTIQSSEHDLANVVPLIKENLNTLMSEIRKLLALLRPTDTTNNTSQ